MKQDKLKILELFGGIGAFSAALDRLKIPYEIADYVEIDKYAVKSYNAIHNTNFEPQDICQWDKNIDVDFIMHGSPCFTKDTLILTKQGYKPIGEIHEDDFVLDKNNEYQKVLKWIPQGKKEIWNLCILGNHLIHTTEDHRFLTINKHKKWNKEKRTYDTVLSEPTWKKCKDLSKQDYIGYAINQESKIPSKEELASLLSYNDDPNVFSKLNLENPVIWYLAGCYCSNGQSDFNQIHHNLAEIHPTGSRIYIHHKNIQKCLSKIKNHYEPMEIGETVGGDAILRFYQNDLCDFLSLFENGSGNYSHMFHSLPSFVFDLPIVYLKEFLEGYFDARCADSRGQIMYPTSSLKVLYGLKQCIAKVYHMPSYITKTTPKNEDDRFPIMYLRFSKKESSSVLFHDNQLWFPVKSVENTHYFEEVYDITVENSHSFTANGMIAHNCQDFSIAGLQAGGDKDSGTRSSLMYETVRIVQKLKPKYVLWENVANMMSDKHRHNFDAYWDAMEKFGYHNTSWKLNAKDYGIPQNRVRIFTLSVLEEYWKPEYFLPPKGQKLERCLADILESNVDNKYYLSDKMVQSLLKHKEKHQAQGHGFGCEIKDVNQEVASPIICGGQGLEKNLIPTERETICLGNTNPSGRGINGNVYYGKVSPTLTTNKGEGLKICVEEPKVHQIGNLFQYKRENPSAGRVYDKNGLSPTLTNMQGGHRQAYIVQRSHGYNRGKILSLAPSLTSSYYQENNFAILPLIAAMRERYVDPVIGRSIGRNPENPSRRVAGDPTEQRLEINAKGLCNTLTSVQKDNLVVEPKMTSGSDIAGCIRSSIYKQGSRNLIENILHKRGYEGVLEPVGLPVVNATKQGYEMAYPGDSVNLNYPDSKTRRGRVGKGCAQTLTCSDSMGVVVDNILSNRGYEGVLEPSLQFLGGIGEKDWARDGKKLSRNYPQGQRVYDANGLACSQTAQGGGLGSYTGLYYSHYRIRKLTPRECWRLMGFQDEEFEKAQAVCSNTQLYKQAGNSIVVNVLVAILQNIFLNKE